MAGSQPQRGFVERVTRRAASEFIFGRDGQAASGIGTLPLPQLSPPSAEEVNLTAQLDALLGQQQDALRGLVEGQASIIPDKPVARRVEQPTSFLGLLNNLLAGVSEGRAARRETANQRIAIEQAERKNELEIAGLSQQLVSQRLGLLSQARETRFKRDKEVFELTIDRAKGSAEIKDKKSLAKRRGVSNVLDIIGEGRQVLKTTADITGAKAGRRLEAGRLKVSQRNAAVAEENVQLRRKELEAARLKGDPADIKRKEKNVQATAKAKLQIIKDWQKAGLANNVAAIGGKVKLTDGTEVNLNDMRDVAIKAFNLTDLQYERLLKESEGFVEQAAVTTEETPEQVLRRQRPDLTDEQIQQVIAASGG